MTLEEFIEDSKRYSFGSRAHLDEPGFSTLYARYTRRYVLGAWHRPVLDIASIATPTPGAGLFTELFHRIRRNHPTLPIYVESVLNDRFGRKLEMLGFTRVDLGPSPCYFLQPPTGT